MKNIMKKAWEIARWGQKKFGGKVSEYFAESLKLAWGMYKKSEKDLARGVVANRQGDYIVLGVREDLDDSMKVYNRYPSNPAREWEIKEQGTRQDNRGNEWNFTRIEAYLTVEVLGHKISSTLNKEIVWS